MAFPFPLLLHTLLTLCFVLLSLTRASGGDGAVADDDTKQISLDLGTGEITMATSTSIYDDFDEFEGESEFRVRHALVGRTTLTIAGELKVRFVRTPEVAPRSRVVAGEIDPATVTVPPLEVNLRIGSGNNVCISINIMFI
ncbi:hypothetical protein L6452_44336 [Arctium lappa]|uniref:Uncharacterized protein n=1 Tax=Arctium lappa TaxID=4217 RepID=A0ACB8XFK9_ARCLA|nr:hypothetical protein L6452_44336 [Arctium lappa]